MAPTRTTRDKAARERLGALLMRRRVELDPRYRNRALFAREKGIHYRLVQDTENAADTRANLEEQTKALIEVAYELAPGSVGDVMAGGSSLRPALAAGPDRRPEIVRQLWGHEHVRTLWGIDRPESERLALVRSYADMLVSPPAAEHRKRA